MQLLGPEDMVNPHVDELSMMTYLSQYPDAKLKPGAPIKARGDPSKVRTIIMSTEVSAMILLWKISTEEALNYLICH